jgi:hypothetical protein
MFQEVTDSASKINEAGKTDMARKKRSALARMAGHDDVPEQGLKFLSKNKIDCIDC